MRLVERGMKTVTVDTNLASDEELLDCATAADFDVCVVSTTDREFEGTSFRRLPATAVLETAVFGESRFGMAVLGDRADHDAFETILAIISSGSFPKAGARDQLSPGDSRHLRDAMIFAAHVREGRDLFVSEDQGFCDGGRRDRLQALFRTTILNRDEFIALCTSAVPDPS